MIVSLVVGLEVGRGVGPHSWASHGTVYRPWSISPYEDSSSSQVLVAAGSREPEDPTTQLTSHLVTVENDGVSKDLTIQSI